MRNVLSAVALCAVAGCAGGSLNLLSHGSAQERKVDSTGGVIALKGSRDKAQAQAEQFMAERCKGPYRIVSEEEVVIGANPNAWAGGSNPTELRLTYLCGAAASATAPATTPAAATAPAAKSP